jgi:hypothetical protein
MKYHPPLLLTAVLLSFGAVQSSFGFTAVTSVSNVTIVDIGLPGPSVGDQFQVLGGSFSSYTPGVGDPVISAADLHFYRFNMAGTVSSINSLIVNYSGFYEIFYDGNTDGMLSDPLDFSFSAGTLDLAVDFNASNPFPVAGALHQLTGPPQGFPSAGFSNPNATFTGTYTQNFTKPGGELNGTIQSVPDGGSSLILLGLSILGTLVAKRKFSA